MPLLDIHEDRSLYVLEGAIKVADDLFDAGRMVVFRPGDAVSITTGSQGARVMVLGATPERGHATSAGTLWRLRANVLARRKRHGDQRIGAMAGFNCRPAMIRNLFRYHEKRGRCRALHFFIKMQVACA